MPRPVWIALLLALAGAAARAGGLKATVAGHTSASGMLSLPINTMTEIVVFLIIGLAMHPHQMIASLPEGIMIALGMMLIAPPLRVMIFQKFSPFSRREAVLISWCGLRGAVPPALSFSVIEAIAKINGIDPQLVQPLMDNVEVIVFRAVVLNLLIQGLSQPHLCRFLGIGQDRTLPEPDQAVA